MKANQIKIRFIKLDGVNFLQSKGRLDTDKKVAEEKKRKHIIFRETETYKVDTTHIKRDRKGKAVIGIDLSNHKSFDLSEGIKAEANLKCQNCLGYMMQEKNWKAHQSSAKIPKWHDIKMMLAGLGIAFIINYIISVIIGRVF